MSYTLHRKTARQTYKPGPILEGGRRHTSVPDCIEDLSYEVTISEAGLVIMARDAAANKGGKCVDGPVTVKIVNRKRRE